MIYLIIGILIALVFYYLGRNEMKEEYKKETMDMIEKEIDKIGTKECPMCHRQHSSVDNISHAQHRLFRSIMLPALIDIMRWLINFDCIYARDRKLEIEFDNGTGQEIDKILTMYIDYDE
jgi:hypothetical protein